MYRHQIKAALDEGRKRLQSFPDCAECKHRSDAHMMNCMECCPVRRRQESSVSGASAADSSAAPGCGRCKGKEYFGKKCDCADCNHIDGVCIAHSSGSGCSQCDGPVHGCDLSDYE